MFFVFLALQGLYIAVMVNYFSSYKKRHSMNILFTAAEVFPFAKSGGLGDVASYLPKEWEKLGYHVIVIMPKYKSIDIARYGITPTNTVVSVPMGHWTEYARLWQGTLPGSNVKVYFLESEYFERDGIYGNPDGYADNDRRFIFLSRAVFEAAKAINFTPDIVHANDWHTAYTMPFLKIHYRYDSHFNRAAGVYSIHNAIFQGMADPRTVLPLAGFGVEQCYPGSWFEYHGSVNAMKLGIMFADKVTTVSPTYANEIRYTEQGYGMQASLNARAADFVGILNGVDYCEWNPAIDARLYATYTPDNLSGKQINKLSYLRDYGVAEHESFADMPLIGMVSRLTDQKGLDLVEQSLEQLLNSFPIRFTLIGSGASYYENFFQRMARKYGSRAIVHIGYDDTIAHRIEAAADIFLMPSRFEPCGLNQMYSLKYGTIPVVRSTGGLADTVQEFNYSTGRGNGFVFHDTAQHDLIWAVDRAVNTYFNKHVWKTIMQNAMACDYSATRSAESYVQVFQWALEKVR